MFIFLNCINTLIVVQFVMKDSRRNRKLCASAVKPAPFTLTLNDLVAVEYFVKRHLGGDRDAFSFQIYDLEPYETMAAVLHRDDPSHSGSYVLARVWHVLTHVWHVLTHVLCPHLCV